MYGAFFRQSLWVILLVSMLASSQVYGKPPPSRGIVAAVNKFFANTHPVAYVPPLVLPALGLVSDTTVSDGLVIGCLLFIAVRALCPYTSKAAIDEVVHYTTADGREHIDKVVIRTLDGEGVLLLLDKDDNRIPPSQIQGFGSSYDHFDHLGNNKFAHHQKVLFPISAAQPLNDVAVRLISEGVDTVEGRTSYFFDNGKINVEVEHSFTDDGNIQGKAQFIINRNEILLTND